MGYLESNLQLAADKTSNKNKIIIYKKYTQGFGQNNRHTTATAHISLLTWSWPAFAFSIAAVLLGMGL
jgi:hypothetical protein